MENQQSASFWDATMQNAEDLDQLREDATQTARDIIDGVRENFISNEDFRTFHEQLDNRFLQLDTINNNIMNLINTLNERMNMNQENPAGRPFERLDTPRPLADNDSDDTSTRYDLDHDVIMRNRITYPIKQVPEPGFFSGDTKETELFCQLCEDTFKTYPNRDLPEEIKINFVKSRLRDSARNWYLAKYRGNLAPATMKELVDGLKDGFRNVASIKLAKIELVNLRQSYGNINEYIEQFRSYTRQFNWDDETLTLLFYNGLHSVYQKEIDKADTFPTKLEDIITKCIIFESNQIAKNRIKKANNSGSNKRKNTNRSKNQNSKNNKFKNYNNYNSYNKNYNKYNSNQNNNKDNSDVSKATKISSKN